METCLSATGQGLRPSRILSMKSQSEGLMSAFPPPSSGKKCAHMCDMHMCVHAHTHTHTHTRTHTMPLHRHVRQAGETQTEAPCRFYEMSVGTRRNMVGDARGSGKQHLRLTPAAPTTAGQGTLLCSFCLQTLHGCLSIGSHSADKALCSAESQPLRG